MTVPDAIARIMSAYEEGSVVHSHGRFEDGERRHVLRCPDGRYVVLNTESAALHRVAERCGESWMYPNPDGGDPARHVCADAPSPPTNTLGQRCTRCGKDVWQLWNLASRPYCIDCISRPAARVDARRNRRP